MKEAIEQAADNYVKSMVAPSVSSEGMENIKTDFKAGYLEGYAQQQAEYQQLREAFEELLFNYIDLLYEEDDKSGIEIGLRFWKHKAGINPLTPNH